jgi:hypothetical protein
MIRSIRPSETVPACMQVRCRIGPASRATASCGSAGASDRGRNRRGPGRGDRRRPVRAGGPAARCARVHRPDGRVKDQAAPGRASGAGGVLEAVVRDPIMGERERGAVCGCLAPRCSLCVRSGVAWLRSSLRGSRGLPAAGAWGGPRAGSGINQRHGRAARGREPDLRAITRCLYPGLLTRSRGCGRPRSLT